MARKTALNQAGFDCLMKRYRNGVDEASSKPWVSSSFQGGTRPAGAEGGTVAAQADLRPAQSRYTRSEELRQ